MRSSALAGALSLALGSAALGADAKVVAFDLPSQALGESLRDFYRASGEQIVFAESLVAGRRSPAVKGDYTPDQALAMLLEGANLTARRTSTGVVMIEAPQAGSATGGGAEVEALIVTAQKREEDIQDVPIAISAFTQEDLTRSQVAGGPDLMTQVPNMTFTKTNFSSYSIQIRGIGTQAISATTDPGVAVAFNNTPFVRNRFFEQEFYDLQRIEVLRGPQGTLYGRNATAGVVNIISQKPKFAYEAKLSGDVSNYNSTRLEGMVNIPLVEDKAALRLAGAWTKRDGFVTNQLTGNPIDGRDLWSTRLSLRVSPNDRIDANLIWEHFEENDDRLRSGKQTCKTHEVTEFEAIFPDGTVQVFQTGHYDKVYDTGQGGGALFSGVQATFSKGCEESSLYSPDSFQTPNGLSVPYYIAIQSIGFPGFPVDPYVSRFQSQDLRVIESTIDPKYRAKSDLAELQLSFDITPSLTLSSETAYSTDFVFSSQDFNRFNTAPGAFQNSLERPGILNDGVFCDPQIGCADRLVAMDLSTARSRHFSQEFRLASDFDGPANFSLGANFLRYDTEDKYYVFINSLSLLAAMATLEGLTYGSEEFRAYVAGETDNRVCLNDGPIPPNPAVIQEVQGCVYIDPNPIENLNDQGHNYFLSRNPYKLISYAMFGEAYYQVSDNLKITAGLRWTVDKKEAPTLPSWLLATQSVGYPVTGVVRQEWREPTGRLTIDWKPDLNFTDETLLYASFAHGYKAGGANPPPAGPSTYSGGGALAAAIVHKSSAHPQTFEPEFVNAIEVGAKNTLLDGKLTVNAAAFYYDYTGYQISQIIDRSAINFNFDSRIWGLEVEADWRPLENLRLGFKGGYENTRVADGEKAIDIMDRTAGHEGWVVVRPFPTMTANCILPAWLYVRSEGASTDLVNLGAPSGGNPAGCELAYLLGLDPVTRQPYVPNPGNVGEAAMHPNYPGWDPSTAPNNGEGFDKELGGNELPNAPHFTATITADYTIPLPNDWLATLHTDLYYQSEAWTRIFNTEGYDKLKAYTNINLAAIFTNEDAGWKVMAYVKNVMDRDSITGAFLFSDDTGLTTNVFLTEPRLYGLRVTKEFTGGPWWTGANPDHPVGQPYPFTIELGGSALRTDAPYDPVSPVFEDNLSSTLQPSVAAIQNRDLDWGDGREIKLTYARNGWRVSAGMRTGDTNGGSHKSLATELGDYGCRSAAPCDPYITSVGHPHGFNYVDGDVRDTERHTIVDFVVGREVGIGTFGMKSTLSAGLRYVELESKTRFIGFAVPDWDIPDAFAYVYNGLHSTHHRYETDITAEREFEGYGPVLSWYAARQLLGDDASGHLDLDWSLEGGVLFGKQRTFGSGQEDAQFFSGSFYYDYATTLLQGPIVVTPPATPARSRSVTVPTFAATLGLSYEIQRLTVSTGYRWERYFDALDVGWATPRDADRTIDGPYFKLSVGFGG